eukprot:447815_1
MGNITNKKEAPVSNRIKLESTKPFANSGEEAVYMELIENKIQLINYAHKIRIIAMLLQKDENTLKELLKHKIEFNHKRTLNYKQRKYIDAQLADYDTNKTFSDKLVDPDDEQIHKWITVLDSTEPLSLIILYYIMAHMTMKKIIYIDHLIYQHYQNIDALYSTLQAINFIGFDISKDKHKLLLNKTYRFTDFTFYLTLHVAKLFHTHDGYETANKPAIRYGRKSVNEFNFNSAETENKINLLQFDNNQNEESMDLINGFLKLKSRFNRKCIPFIPLDVIRICMKYYIVPNIDTCYKYIWCNVHYGGNTMKVFDVVNNKKYDIQIAESGCESEVLRLRCNSPFVVKNVSFPRWMNNLTQDKISLYDNIKNKNNLCVIFQPIMMIIFDPYNNIGHKIKYTMNAASHRILGYNPSNNSILCRISGKYDEILEYNIDSNDIVNTYDMNMKHQITSKDAACLFDKNSKLFVAGIDCNVFSLCDDIQYTVSNMNIRRGGHTLLYQKEFKQIVVGGGLGRFASTLMEIFDITKNKWNILYKQTRYKYGHKPYIWYDNYNPFILNVAKSFVQRRDHNIAEFIDLREQKQWMRNSTINSYFTNNILSSPVLMY